MTKQQFNIMADTWYQRTHRLREVAFSPDESDSRKSKALKLFKAMFVRMQSIIQAAIVQSQPMPPKYPSGGREIIPTP